MANLINGTMKNNFSAVVAFRCNAVSARVLLGKDEENYKAAGMIDPDVEGRALFSFKDQVLIQVPYIDNKMIKEIMSRYQKAIVKGKVEHVIEAVLSVRVSGHSPDDHSPRYATDHAQWLYTTV